MTAPTLAAVGEAIVAHGMIPRGAFLVAARDDVPALPEGRPAQTLVLAGNAGPGMWQAFVSARADDPRLTADQQIDHPLDHWSRLVLDDIATEFGAAVHLPNDGPPYRPFQRWARRAEPLHPSPLGILIHPDYGLWHGYRGALAFAERLDVPPPDSRRSPCDTCADRPCLSTCPADAFSTPGDDGRHYDVPACIAHIDSDAGSDCRQEGCRARRACPVGRDYVYEPAQAEFHTAAFVRAYRK